MRELTSHKVNGCNDGITIQVMDEPGPGGANHQYSIANEFTPQRGVWCLLLSFQNGPIPTNGVNGITHENLLAILEDRLVGFQSGKFACEENAQALHHIRETQRILKSRTEKRLARGVEGTHTV